VAKSTRILAIFTALVITGPALAAEYRPAFIKGEDLLFRIRWGTIVGGYSTLTVPDIEMKDGSPAYHIVSEARSTGFIDTFYTVRDKNEAWLDATAPRSLGYAKNLREGKYRVQEQVSFDQVNNRFRLEEHRLDKDRHEVKEGAIPPNVFDILSSFYYIRGVPLEVGSTVSIDVHSGEKTWPLLIHVKRKEKVKVKAGKFDCFVLEPVLREAGIFIHKGKKLEVWVTADERRMPVQMRCDIVIGAITAELVKVNHAEAGSPSVAQIDNKPIPANN
jgi:hypothetical protein